MKITNLQLENFRSYKKHSHEFDLDKNLTIIVGSNGLGKTNFLEAISMLSLGRSFRSLTQDDLVNWGEDYLRCRAEVNHDMETSELEVFYSSRPQRQKNFKKNGVNQKNSEYLGNLLTVLFQPEDLNMLYQSPTLRRKYMDIVLSQTDRKYLVALTNYRKILRQRNALLKTIREDEFKNKNTDHLRSDLDVWDKKILEFGSVIIACRYKFTEFLNRKVEDIYRSISGHKEKISIGYLTAQNYPEELLSRRRRDIFSAITTVGPHRDDLKFCLDAREIATSASRGEFRTLLLAIKLAEIEYIKEKTKKNPVLLLDDVFSELDRERQSQLLKYVQNCQVIITTTDIANLKEFDDKAKNLTIVRME